MKLPHVSVFIAASLDGFIASKGDGLAWLDVVNSPDGEDYGYAEFMSSIDTVLLGRRTYDVVRSLEQWHYGEKDVTVLTHRPLDPVKNERPASGPLREILANLASRGTERVYLDGGEAVQSGLRDGVVDDLTISLIPILLGDGIPLFGKLGSEIGLEAVSTKKFPMGLIQLKYKVSR